MEGREISLALFGGRINGGSKTTGGLQSTGSVKGIQAGMGKGSHGMDLRNMAKGQTFEGTVIAVKGKSVTIESEGHYLNARIEDSVSISIGEKISFVIRANSNNRIEIAPLRMGSISVEELVQYKALESAGLKATEKNMEIVKGLMKYQMAVNKDSIFHILGYLMKYPDLQVEDILLMKKIKKHVKKIKLYQYKENEEGKKENQNIGNDAAGNVILELETRYLGIITIYIEWEKIKRNMGQNNFYLLVQVEKEHTKELLEEQEKQWKEKLQEKDIICESEYVTIEDNKKAEWITEKFFGKPKSKLNYDVKGKGKLYIQEFLLE